MIFTEAGDLRLSVYVSTDTERFHGCLRAGVNIPLVACRLKGHDIPRCQPCLSEAATLRSRLKDTIPSSPWAAV